MDDDDSVADYWVWGKLAFYLGNDLGQIAMLSSQGAHLRHPEDEAKGRARLTKWARPDPVYGTFVKRQIAKLLSTRTRDDVFGGGVWTTDQRKGATSMGSQPPKVTKVRPLPTLMDGAAYHGPLGRIAREIEPYIEADSGALLVNLVVMAGIAMGRGPYIQVGATQQHAVLYAVTAGETGDNKSDSTNAPTEIVETASAISDNACAPDPVDIPRISGLASGEGLIWQMRDDITKQVTDKKTRNKTTEVVDAGVEDKRLLALEPEFARVLTVMGRDGNTLSTTIRILYDSPTKAQSASKSSPCTASEPHFGLIGHILRLGKELGGRLNDVELTNGFVNRILWLYTRRVQSLPDPPDYSQVVPNHARLWIQAIEQAVKVRRVTRAADATAQWDEVYDQLRQGTRPGLPPREGMAKDVCSRAHTIVIRLSLILAALDGSSVITDSAPDGGAGHLGSLRTLRQLLVWRSCRRPDVKRDPVGAQRRAHEA